MSIVLIAALLSEHCREMLAPPPPPKPGWWSRLLGRKPAAPATPPPDTDRLVDEWRARMAADGRFGDAIHWRWSEQDADDEDASADLGWQMQDALHKWIASNATGCPHLTTAELWLPPRFTAVTEEALPGGHRYVLGSLPSLLDELDALNHATWRATDAQFDAWREEDLSKDDAEPLARAAFWEYRRMARLALSRGWILVLSY